MIVTMCCTRNWYIYLATEVYALFKHNNVKKLYLFIEDDNIPYLLDKRIEFININKTPEFITKKSPNYKTKYTKMSLIRCFFSKILNEDKILYIDADALVVDNIDDLWNMPFDDNVIIGIKEPGEWSKHLGIEGMDDKYINSGVLLMNLKEMQNQKLDDEMINLLNNNYYYFPDQDVINLVCKDKIKYTSNIYNSTETTGIVDNAKIIHYIRERKGWIKTSPRSEIWYKYNKEMLGGIEMIRVEVIEDFTLGRFNELKNIQRKNLNTPGRLYKGDVFDATEDLVDYLSGNNRLKRCFLKVIEVLPKEEKKTNTKEVKIELPKEKPIKLDEEDTKTIAEVVNKTTKKKSTKKKTSKK